MTSAGMQKGVCYNFIGMPERLVYIGLNWSGNGCWHQFERIEQPGTVWAELQDEDLRMIEEASYD